MSEVLLQINEYLDLLFVYGPFWVYAVIFVACFIENIFPPFPGDSFIVAAGGLVAASRLDPYLALLSVLAGGMGSVMMIYMFGRRYGRNYFIKKDFRFFSAADIVSIEARFSRQGGLLLVASRFVVGFRVALAVAAGISGYSAVRMFAYTLISYLGFAGLLMYLGYKLIENLDQVEYYFRTYNYILWPIVVALVAIYLFRRIKAIREGKTK